MAAAIVAGILQVIICIVCFAAVAIRREDRASRPARPAPVWQVPAALTVQDRAWLRGHLDLAEQPSTRDQETP